MLQWIFSVADAQARNMTKTDEEAQWPCGEQIEYTVVRGRTNNCCPLCAAMKTSVVIGVLVAVIIGIVGTATVVYAEWALRCVKAVSVFLANPKVACCVSLVSS